MAESIVLDSLEKELVERGYNEMSLYNKNQLVVNIGSKTGIEYTTITEKDVLDYHKKLKENVLSETCESNILAGFISSNGHSYRTNRDDQINLIGQKDAINTLGLTVVQWKTEDAGYLEHSAEDWLVVYAEAFTHKQDKLFTYNQLKGRINSATTHEEIIEVGWPGDEPDEQVEEI